MGSNSYDKCIHHYNDEILNLFDPEIQLINTKAMIKNKIWALLNDLEKFKFRQYFSLTIRKKIVLKSSIRVLNY